MAFSVVGPDIILDVVYDANDVAVSFETYVERLSKYWRQRLTPIKRPPITELDRRTCDEIVDLLRGDFDGRLSLRSRADRVDKEILRLTKEQYLVLDGLADNDRAIISGGAGTGKTMLAVEEAARFSRAGKTVFVACYNRGLAEFLRRATSEMVGVTVSSLHSYMADAIARSGLEGDLPDAAQWGALPGLLSGTRLSGSSRAADT